jgi:manganese transport protein
MTTDARGEGRRPVETGTEPGGVRERLSAMGPTWIAGAIAAGPATMASLLTGGASFGYALLWVVLLSAGLGALAQYLSTRLGLLTERGIVGVVEDHLGDSWAWLLVADVVLAAGLAQLVIMKTVADVSATVTGVDARIWGVAWAVVLALGLAGGGYRFVEFGAKLLVSAVVFAFFATLFVAPVEPAAAITGLVPRLPAGVDGAVVAAGILGGAVHVTLVTMQSYTMRARGWDADDAGLATFDVVASMLVAFGVYSVAIFLVAASVLHGQVDPGNLTAVAAAQALGPLVGPAAKWLFLLGLWGAAVSTLGGNTVVPPYLLADKLGWEADVSDSRYRALLAAVALLSAGGAFLGGSFFPLLVLVLAFGLLGTPFALVVVLYLLNHPDAVPEPNSTLANAGGVVLVLLTAGYAATAMRRYLADAAGPVTVAVVAFAAVLAGAGLLLVARYVRFVAFETGGAGADARD